MRVSEEKGMDSIMPLSFSKRGERSRIKKITGRDDIRLHLAELGFVVGEYVTVVNELGGNMIVDVKGSRIALDKSMLNRIMV